AALPPPSVPAPLSSPTSVNLQVGTRLGLRVQTPQTPDRLGSLQSDGVAAIVLWGKVHPLLAWQAGMVGAYLTDQTTHAELLDLVAKVEIAEAFNLWLGRMPMPSDRTSLATIWALPTWTVPGSYVGPLGANPNFWPGPRYGSLGRGDGVSLWGQWRGGLVKYYLGAFDLDQTTASPLYTGRLSLSLFNPEPGYRTSSGYYGAKNVLSLGVGAQHQASTTSSAATPTAASDDFNEVNVDLLCEKNGGSAGVVDVESAFHETWDNGRASQQILALASYLVPIEIGIGLFQPLLRYQHITDGRGPELGKSTVLDAQLGYIIAGYGARLLASYQYLEAPGSHQNAVLIGLQLLSRPGPP
ncbi:MAG: hypothetical protein ABSB49_21510, partial [Polyangia bacterium]